MIVNRFAEEMDFPRDVVTTSRLDDGRDIGRTSPSPKPGASKRSRQSQYLSGESLSNRVSFYIDDVVVPSNSGDLTPDLRRQPSFKMFKDIVLGNESPALRRSIKSRSKVLRHHSDLSSMRKPSRLQRKRSANRRPLVRHESLERRTDNCGGGGRYLGADHHLRASSVRSSGRLRRQDSAISRHSSASRRSSPAVKLPRKDLPPKERRRRIVVLIVVLTCLFLVSCSVLAVIITLTHRSFHSSTYVPDNSSFLNISDTVRKQNEQHQNSLSREGETGGGLFNLFCSPERNQYGHFLPVSVRRLNTQPPNYCTASS
uniref:(California timema) hypothetical protein n=1 Tax=Timema californicum TaxID=61474 RepID=A0A7R9IXY4_TIMCA|nr:unnamed protein product [Timema californicum]